MQEASVPRFTDEDKDEDGERKKKHSSATVTLKGSGVRRLLRGQRQQAVEEGSESVFCVTFQGCPGMDEALSVT